MRGSSAPLPVAVRGHRRLGSEGGDAAATPRGVCPRDAMRALGGDDRDASGWDDVSALVCAQDRAALAAARDEVARTGDATWVVLRSEPRRGEPRCVLATVLPTGDGGARIDDAVVLPAQAPVAEALAATQLRCVALWERSLAARDDERRRVARELHDLSGSSLASVLVLCRLLDDASSLAAARTLARRVAHDVVAVLEDLAQISRNLPPVPLTRVGLAAALSQLAERLVEPLGLDVDLEIRLDGRLRPELEHALYRIAQEALTNVARHADARRVRIGAWRTGDDAVLRIEDDGRGFCPAARAGNGLTGIEERAAAAQGKATVRSAPSQGTVVEARIPVRSPR